MLSWNTASSRVKAEWRNNEGKHQQEQEGSCIVMSQEGAGGQVRVVLTGASGADDGPHVDM